MSGLIRTGNPIGKSSLVGEITKGLVRTSSVEKGSIHGSDAAFCSRKAVLHIGVDSPEKVDLDPASTLYFAVGNSIHDAIFQALKNSGVLIANELKVEYGLIRGYIDNIVISAETGGLKIIDIKTAGTLPNKIKPGQAEQLLLYALLTGISEASIIYVSRNVADYNGLLIKEIQAPITGNSMKQIARVTAESLVYTEHHVVPPMPEYHTTRSGCNWCPFKENGCHSTDEGIRPLMKSTDSELGYHYMIPGEMEELELKVVRLATELLANKKAFYAKLLEKLATSKSTIKPVFEAWKAGK